MLKQKTELDLVKEEQKKEIDEDNPRVHRKSRKQNETLDHKAVGIAKNNDLCKRRCLRNNKGFSKGEVELTIQQSFDKKPKKPEGKIRQNTISNKIRKELLREHMRQHMKKFRDKQRMMHTSNEMELKNGKDQQNESHLQETLQEKKRSHQYLENHREYVKEYSKVRRLLETPEEKEVRLKKDRDSTKIRRQNKMRTENPHNSPKSENMIEDRKSKRMVETTEEKVAAVEKDNEAIRIKKENIRLLIIQNELDTKKLQERLLRLQLLNKIRQYFTPPEQNEDQFKKDTERKHLFDQNKIEMYKLKQCKENDAVSSQESQIKTLSQQPSLCTTDAKIKNKVLQENGLEIIPKINQDSQDDKLLERTDASLVLQENGLKIIPKLNQDSQDDKLLERTDAILVLQENGLKMIPKLNQDSQDDKLLERTGANLVLQENGLTIIPKLNQDSQDDKLLESPEASSVSDHKLDFTQNVSVKQDCWPNKKNISSYFSCMKRVIDLNMRDRYSIYGENLANQIRKSGKSDKEICIAKRLIDNVLQNLNFDNKTSEKH